MSSTSLSKFCFVSGQKEDRDDGAGGTTYSKDALDGLPAYSKDALDGLPPIGGSDESVFSTVGAGLSLAPIKGGKDAFAALSIVE
jgi:hypothetical protein